VGLQALGREGLHDPAAGVATGDNGGDDVAAEMDRGSRRVDAFAARQRYEFDGAQHLVELDVLDVRGPVDSRRRRDAQQRRAASRAASRAGRRS
jgi:hypothetical protein